MTKAIIFDLGGVILIQPENVSSIILKRILPNYEKEAILLFRTFLNPMVVGKISTREYFQKCKDELNLRQSAKSLTNQWEVEYSQLIKVDGRMLNLIDALRKNYKIVILTNTIDSHYNQFMKTEIPSHVDEIIASYRVRLRKPFKEIYLQTLKKLGTTSDEVVFIDNKVENVEAARKLGMKGIVFKSPDQLRLRLKDLGAVL